MFNCFRRLCRGHYVEPAEMEQRAQQVTQATKDLQSKADRSKAWSDKILSNFPPLDRLLGHLRVAFKNNIDAGHMHINAIKTGVVSKETTSFQVYIDGNYHPNFPVIERVATCQDSIYKGPNGIAPRRDQPLFDEIHQALWIAKRPDNQGRKWNDKNHLGNPNNSRNVERWSAPREEPKGVDINLYELDEEGYCNG